MFGFVWEALQMTKFWSCERADVKLNCSDFSAFLLTEYKNLQEDHFSSICNAPMITTGAIETSAICC